MPPRLRRLQQRVEELPLYDATGRLKLVPPPTTQPLELEPSPLIEAILKYLDTSA